MKAEQFTPSFNHKRPSNGPEGSFNTRVTTVEGTRPPSRVKPLSSPVAGNVHRNSVREFKQHDLNHKPYSTAHRPEEPQDLGRLKRNQEAMLSQRQRKKNRES